MIRYDYLNAIIPMTSAIKGFHYGQSKHNELQQLITKTIVIGVVAPVLAAVALSKTVRIFY